MRGLDDMKLAHEYVYLAAQFCTHTNFAEVFQALESDDKCLQICMPSCDIRCITGVVG